MINHISLNGILRDIDSDNPNIRYIEVTRNYKNEFGVYPTDIFPCCLWTRNNKNSLFSYSKGTFVSIDGRLEVISGKATIVIEIITYLAGENVNILARSK